MCELMVLNFLKGLLLRYESKFSCLYEIKADITGSGVDLRGGSVDPLQGGDEEAAG